jgi:hypothetical protein
VLYLIERWLLTPVGGRTGVRDDSVDPHRRSVLVDADRYSRVDFHSGIHIPTRVVAGRCSRGRDPALISKFTALWGSQTPQ